MQSIARPLIQNHMDEKMPICYVYITKIKQINGYKMSIQDTHPDENFYCKKGKLGWVFYDCGDAIHTEPTLTEAKDWLKIYFEQCQQFLPKGEPVELSCAFFTDKHALVELVTSTELIQS